MKNILIIKTSSLGDIIHTYPVLDFLRDKFPDATIDWVVEKPFADLVESHPKISNVITVSTKSWRRNIFKVSTYTEIREFRRQISNKNYDVVFDLQGNVKSGLILSQVRSKKKVGFARKFVPEWPNMLFTNIRIDPSKGRNIREDYLSIVKGFFDVHEDGKNVRDGKYDNVVLKISDIQKAGVQSILQGLTNLGPKVIVCPGSAWHNKQLPIETLIAFLSEVQPHLECEFLFLWGTSEEREIADRLHQEFINASVVIDRISLPMVQNLMNEVDLVIAMDSLPLHLVGTTSTPSFSIFGPSLAQKYKPMGPMHVAFQGSCPYGRTLEKRCPILRTCPTGACIREISSKELFATFQNWWQKIATKELVNTKL